MEHFMIYDAKIKKHTTFTEAIEVKDLHRLYNISTFHISFIGREIDEGKNDSTNAFFSTIRKNAIFSRN